MAEIKTFYLPDLGEGLPDATIVEWLVREGGSVHLDDPLVSVETAKAVVELPSPYSGRLVKVHGRAGTVIATGAALADFALDPNAPQRAEAETTGHHHAPTQPALIQSPAASGAARAGYADTGTVVGAMQSSDRVHAEPAASIGAVKAVPAVRALAKKLGVDLARVAPSGADGVVTLKDVRDAASRPAPAAPTVARAAQVVPSTVVPVMPPAAPQVTAPAISRAAPAPLAAASTPPAPFVPVPLAASAPLAPVSPAPAAVYSAAPQPAQRTRTVLASNGKPIRTTPPTVAAIGQPEQLKGVRRNMARVMAATHAAVAPTTICDDADINAWIKGNDVTARLVRAMVSACRAVPTLNAWFDGENLTRTLHPHVDVGIAVDTEEGLFVPALRNAHMLDMAGVRAAVNRLRSEVEARSIPPDELGGYTISLSNFGMFAGRYATAIVVPPCVAIVAAGKGRHQMTPVMGGFESHRVIPLSLTFDHRAVTGGEAARFFKAMVDDFMLAQ